MSADPPASRMITLDLRRRLQQRYEEAVRLMRDGAVDHARVHELLAECLRADPGNILYLDAMLANLRRWQQKSKHEQKSWLGKWVPAGWRRPRNDASSNRALSTEYSVLGTQYLADDPIDETAAKQLLHAAPEALRRSPTNTSLYLALPRRAPRAISTRPRFATCKPPSKNRHATQTRCGCWPAL
jgi:hypothetical protein